MIILNEHSFGKGCTKFPIFNFQSEEPLTIVTSYVLELLGMYPKVQEKVINEIYSVLGNAKREISEYDLPKLEYLDMVIKEALRLFPVSPFILRKSLEEYSLGYIFLLLICLDRMFCTFKILTKKTR